MKRFSGGLWLYLLAPFISGAQDAQFAPFRGGQADGHTLSQINNFAQGFTTMFGPFTGAALADGYASDSLIAFNQRGPVILFAPFAGGTADGYQSDSLMAFNPRGFIQLFSVFSGGIGDGYAYDSSILFNPRSYIQMYQPFAGGIADGHHEGVICNFPKIDGDTTILLLCPNDVVNLDSVVLNYNFAARWNTASPEAAGTGVYELRINNAGKCLDTATVIVKPDIVRWTGTADNNWHNPANWNTGKVPSDISHVIVPGGTPHPCEIFAADAHAASVQALPNAIVQTMGNKVLWIKGTCTVLPSN